MNSVLNDELRATVETVPRFRISSTQSVDAGPPGPTTRCSKPANVKLRRNSTEGRARMTAAWQGDQRAAAARLLLQCIDDSDVTQGPGARVARAIIIMIHSDLKVEPATVIVGAGCRGRVMVVLRRRAGRGPARRSESARAGSVIQPQGPQIPQAALRLG
jgi:hypothetical protein